jgi:hypothetical protein
VRTATVIALLIVAGAMNCGPVSADETWGAVDPNEEVSAPVVWGNTEAEAKQRAIDACGQVSQSCAGSPASTDDMNDVFAAMCCQRPHLGCAIGVGKTRNEALRAVRKTFSDAGYTNCGLRHYLSARTGGKL